MAHARKVIRDQVVTALANAAIVGAGKVYSNRALSVPESDLPVLNVFAASEASAPQDLSTKKLTRELDLVVELTAAAATDETIDDVLDGYAETIESTMSAFWSAADFDAHLSGTEIISEAGGEKPMGSIRLTYTARYHA